MLVLDAGDDVAILTGRAREGETPLGAGAPLGATVQAGHKLARHDIASGAPIRKFGQIIGYATEAIAQGAQVHGHNCAIGDHDRDNAIGADLDAARAAFPADPKREFHVYVRSDGRVATRNYIALVATVNCSATAIRQAADRVNRSSVLDACPNVNGVVAFAHGTGCGMASEGPGWENLQRVLWGHATHPNVGASLSSASVAR